MGARFPRSSEISRAVFFQGVGQVAVSLPLEEKHRIKAGLITLLSQGGSRDSWKHLVEDDQRLKRILVGRGWWVLQKDITGTVKREILRLGRDPEPGAVDAYLCGLFRADDLSRRRAERRGRLASGSRSRGAISVIRIAAQTPVSPIVSTPLGSSSLDSRCANRRIRCTFRVLQFDVFMLFLYFPIS